MMSISDRIWALRYELEDGRRIAAARRAYLREAGCCVLLFALGLWGSA